MTLGSFGNFLSGTGIGDGTCAPPAATPRHRTTKRQKRFTKFRGIEFLYNYRKLAISSSRCETEFSRSILS